MNVPEYIESGILDVYVLGGLSHEEALEVERLAAFHPEISNEIEKLRTSIEKLLLTQQVTPSPDLKQRILGAVENKEHRSTQKKVRIFSYTQWALAASWIIGVFLGGLSYYYHHQWKLAESKVLALESQQQELANQYNLTKQDYSEANRKLSLVSDTTIKWVALNQLPNKPVAFAKVMWDPAKGDIYLNANYMPQVPPGKQYQLWAIVDGKPVDVGMVPISGLTELIKMKQAFHASAFAITLENLGGSPVPTLEEMCVMGGV
jgi:anti-sigma-K factor RskA